MIFRGDYTGAKMSIMGKIFIRVIGILCLISLITGFSDAHGWVWIDVTFIFVWVFGELWDW